MRMREVLILGLLVLLLQVFDGAVTGYIVAKFGTQMENNHLAREVMDGMGISFGVIVFKGIAIIAVLYMLWAAWMREQAHQMVVRLLWLALGVYMVMAYQWLQTLQVLSSAARVLH